MILVTVGTHEAPFDRLIRAAVGAAGEEERLVQYGFSNPLDSGPEWVRFMSFEDLRAAVARARAVVAHAGVGSILLANQLGRKPIVMPRRKEHWEHVDDHQVHLASRLAELGLITVVDDEAGLRTALVQEEGCSAEPAGLDRQGALVHDLRSYLCELTASGTASMEAAR